MMHVQGEKLLCSLINIVCSERSDHLLCDHYDTRTVFVDLDYMQYKPQTYSDQLSSFELRHQIVT